MMIATLTFIGALTAQQLLDCSISHHDPQGVWARRAFQITELASRPDGKSHRNVLRFDTARGLYQLDSAIDGRSLPVTVQSDSVAATLDGKTNLTPEEIQSFRLTPAQVLSRRNRDVYLWGLPMKLRDPGTRLDPTVKETTVGGKAVHQLRVTYDANVGRDAWYFFLDPGTCALVGHRFHHDEAKGDGEYALFAEEIAGQGLRLPRVRRWYSNKSGEPVITHTILSIAAWAAE
jgi:hypothetical protein